jgi:hypothetical protein
MYYQEFGPWRNRYGYAITMACVDDMFMLKAVTPYGTKRITYHWSEESAERQIELYNQDRVY